MKDYKIDLMENQNLVSFFLRLPRQARRFSIYSAKFDRFQTKICQTKPISKTPKMLVSAVVIMTTNKKLRTMNYPKQTQSNPILPRQKGYQTQTKPNLPACMAGKFTLSAVEGPIKIVPSAVEGPMSETNCKKFLLQNLLILLQFFVLGAF
jgi:hypothetical protein